MGSLAVVEQIFQRIVFLFFLYSILDSLGHENIHELIVRKILWEKYGQIHMKVEYYETPQLAEELLSVSDCSRRVNLVFSGV